MKYYEILDVPPDATPEQIKAAYRILVQLHHPDRLQQSNPSVRQYAEERLKRINEAYTVLSDPAKRAKYDALYAHRTRRAAPSEYDAPAEPWPAPARKRRARQRTAEQTAYESAADEILRQAAEREAEAREAERQRRGRGTRTRAPRWQKNARRAAEERYRRARSGERVDRELRPRCVDGARARPGGRISWGAIRR
jgi:curved DNA-binding protein CbpA